MNDPSALVPELQAILSNLVVGDNDIRNAAENSLNEKVEENASGVLTSLALMGTSSEADPNLRAFSLLLLRRLSLKSPPIPSNETQSFSIHPSSLINTLSNQSLSYIRSRLLASLPTEPDNTVRTRLADCVSGLAQAALDDKHLWTELLQGLVEMTTSPVAKVRESAFKIYEDCPGLVEEEEPGAVRRIFANGLTDPYSLEVRLASLRGAVAFLQDASTDVRNGSTELMTGILGLLQNLTSEDLATTLQHLIPLASLHPTIFLPHLPTFLPFILRVASPPEGPLESLEIPDDSPAQPAFELILSLVESKPAMLRKWEGGAFVAQAAKVAISMVGVLDEEEGWGSEELDEEEEDGGWSVWGEECLDRLATSLGGRAMLPAVWGLVEGLLKGEGGGDWKGRYAALITIASVAEGTSKVMEPQLSKVIELICPFVQDPHPRVRYAVVHTIGQLCTDFAFTLQPLHHRELITVILQTFQHPVPRVHCHAAAALVNFCDGVDEPALLAPYLDEIVKGLLQLLNSPNKFVQEQAINSLATVANAAGPSFLRFYDELMPTLLGFLRAPPAEQGDVKDRVLRGKVLECCALIFIAVGPERCKQDARELAEILRALQASITEDDDPLNTYVMMTWGKLCEILREEFAPYLGFLMPSLLESASLTPEVSLMDPDDDPENEIDYTQDWEQVNIGGQNIGIKTSSLQQTAEAFAMLVVYASTLGVHFSPYMEATMTLALKNLTFFFHDEVRQSAAILIPILIATAKQTSQITPQLLNAVFSKLVDVLTSEPDASALAFFVKSFADCVRVVGVENLPLDLRTRFDSGAETQLVDISAKRKLRAERAEGWDMEEKESAYELEREETAALNEFTKLFTLLEPPASGGTHRLAFVCSGVKDLGFAPDEDWEDDE
ncbi:armadillo-type protein [Mrakia frigida]|uniref:importin PSE1 n=1 Tax=Mrakia frigida TaxID=29902 RepID=UPI003FCC0519